MRCGQSAAPAPAIDWVERMAVGASFLCLVHCAGLPLLLALLPALSRVVALPESFHVWILALALPMSGSALLLGASRYRAWRPLGLGSFGLLLLAVGAFPLLGGPWETPVTIAGSLCLMAAHFRNWRLRHRLHRHG